MTDMLKWTQAHANKDCYQLEEDEELFVTVFDWSQREGVPMDFQEIFYDAEEGDFDGMWDGDDVIMSTYVPFALINTSEEMRGAQMEDDLPAQYDSVWVYRREDGRVFEISVDGTAIPQAGLEELGEISELGIKTRDSA